MFVKKSFFAVLLFLFGGLFAGAVSAAPAPAKAPEAVKAPAPVKTPDVRLLLPETIYAVPGVESNIYFNNIVTVINPANYVFDVTCSKGRNDLKRWRFTPTAKDKGTYKWSIRIIGKNGIAASGESKLVVLPADAGAPKDITMLIVGASQTGAGQYADRIADLMARPATSDVSQALEGRKLLRGFLCQKAGADAGGLRSRRRSSGRHLLSLRAFV